MRLPDLSHQSSETEFARPALAVLAVRGVFVVQVILAVVQTPHEEAFQKSAGIGALPALAAEDTQHRGRIPPRRLDLWRTLSGLPAFWVPSTRGPGCSYAGHVSSRQQATCLRRATDSLG